MAGHQPFAGVPAEDDMLGLARHALREAEKADEAASDLTSNSPQMRKAARKREGRLLARGALRAQIATAELLQRLVEQGERSDRIVPDGFGDRVRRVREELGERADDAAPAKTEREEAFERAGRLLAAARDSGERVRIFIDYPDRVDDGLSRPECIRVEAPAVVASTREHFTRDSRLERELHPSTARARRAGA